MGFLKLFWGSRFLRNGPGSSDSSEVKQSGRERKGLPEIIQKYRLRNWPISSTDFPMTPMEGTEHHFGPFGEKDFGAMSGGPFFSQPLWLLLTETLLRFAVPEKQFRQLRFFAYTRAELPPPRPTLLRPQEYHARGNKYISNSRRFFDAYVFVVNSNSLTKRIFNVCVFISVTRSRKCIHICHKINYCKKREVCVSNSKSMALRIVHVCVCVDVY